jgi:hypothetical protein
MLRFEESKKNSGAMLQLSAVTPHRYRKKLEKRDPGA